MGINIGDRCCGRNIVFDSLIGLNPSGSCPAICDTVASVDDLPDPPEGCDFILLYDDIAPRYAAALYEWHDGTGWHYHADFNVVQESNGTFIQFEYEGLQGWQVIVNGVSYMGGSTTITFDNPVYYIEVEFVSPEGCRYTIDPFGEVPSLYVFDMEAEFGSPQAFYSLELPDTSIANIAFPTDVINVQIAGYNIMSATSNNSNPDIRKIYLYTIPTLITGYKIFDPNTSTYVNIDWQLVGSAVANYQCLEYDIVVDELIYPIAQVYAINDDNPNPLSIPMALSISLFAIPIAQFETELAELIRSLFGGNPSVTASYDGTTFNIQLLNTQFIQTTPNYPEFIKILIDLDPGIGNYIYSQPTQITCP
jgi:hypothetical protein